ncbi:N-alpha-acetyltransferase 60 [Halotydeus destructor]|nr:N-alpha-acetyltransferase 60 [Halotydeus destructor]
MNNHPNILIATCRNNSLKLRLVGPPDIPRVKQLCRDWFPIEYPDQWYEEITSNSKFFALAVVDGEEIVGLIVTEIKLQAQCNREDQGLLSFQLTRNTWVAYILTLGVVKEYRRQGIATLLLESLIKNLTDSQYTKQCKAIYLHVLTTNQVAINFYERCKFKKFLYLPLYYSINGAAKDGYSYVLYINGGQAPWAFLSLITEAASDVYSFFTNALCVIASSISESCLSVINAITPRNPVQRLKRWMSSVSNGTASIMFRSSKSHKYQHLANA